MSPKVIVVLALAIAGVAATGCGGDGDSGDDALALGETAVIEYTPTSSSGEPGNATTLAITVTAVRRGTQEELSKGGLEVDAEDRNATPHYIDARFENQGQTPVKRSLDVTLEGPDGETLPRTLIFDAGGDPFKPCPNVSTGTLAPGKSFEDCSLVLVPDGSDAETVLFVSQKANNEIVFTRWDASG